MAFDLVHTLKDRDGIAPMDVTVLLCTYNRALVLAEALERVAASTMPDSIRWEVLVVDNNSSDTTREVVSTFERRYPDRFRYLFEPRPGKSYALNSGIREALGGVMAFMDDDVVVEPSWLFHLTAELLSGSCAGVGGRTLPTQRIPLPSWLSFDGPYAMGGILAASFDLGSDPCDLRVAPFGANMAYRKSVFGKYGGFRTDLGPSPDPSVPRPNEDTEFGRRLLAAGERIRYEPRAVAYHPPPLDRIDQRYFLKWWFDFGRAAIRERGRKPGLGGIPRSWIGIPKMVITLLVPTTLQWIVAVNPQKRFYRKCWIWTVFGQMVEMRRLYRRSSGEKAAPVLNG
jgi:glycosyltransferase involved in cell wall biosynthesis